MNEISNNPATPLSLEEGVGVLLSNARQGIRNRYQKCENRIRKSPTTAVLGAVAAGYFLHRMPVRAILVTHVRVLSALAPPALFLFGAAKLYEFLQRQELANRK
jgi:hypothetical protein